jgi:hypothetical protein
MSTPGTGRPDRCRGSLLWKRSALLPDPFGFEALALLFLSPLTLRSLGLPRGFRDDAVARRDQIQVVACLPKPAVAARTSRPPRTA